MSTVRIAIRSLRRTPLFTVTAILTLALGIALATAAFSLIDGVLIRPLPFGDADRIVTMAQQQSSQQLTAVSYPNFLDWQRSAPPSVEAMAYARGKGTTLQLGGGPRTVIAAFTSPGFFAVMRPAMAMGRGFSRDEEQRGERVAVLTHGVWREQFAGDPAILGKTITVSEGAFTVIGVLPADLTMPEWSQIYLPLETIAAGEKVLSARDFHADSRALARLKPGVDIGRAQAELSAVAARLAAAYPAENREWPAVNLLSLRSTLLGNGANHLAILAGAMALVLLLAWVNVINLSLVRATARSRELAVRTSLGASRSNLVRQLLTEHLLIAAVAAILGALVAAAGIDVIRAVAADVVRANMARIDGAALAFAAGVAVITTLVVGALPALRATRVELTEALKSGSGGSGTSGGQQRIRSTLVVGEIALALTLIIVAGLLAQSYWRINRVDAGFDTRRLVAIDLTPPGTRYREPAQAAAFYRGVLEAVRNTPGVDKAALTNHMPLNGASLPTSVAIEGRTADPARDPSVLFRTISPEYLGTLGIPMRKGREFTDADLGPGDAVLVNQQFADVFLPGGDPVGKRVMLKKSAQGFADYGEPLAGTIVGVVGNVRHYGIATPAVPEIYLPYTRNPWSHMVIVARAHGSAPALIPALRRAVLGVDASTVLTGGVFGGFAIMDDVRDGGVASQRFVMQLYGAFAICALLLAVLGIYGLMAYVVAQRTREIGIRMALGAGRSDVGRLIVGSGAKLVAAGVIIGLLAALATTRLITSMLFGVTTTDLPTFAATTALLATVALLACYLPARRASRVEPVIALRSE